jgi:hypothetical protein
MAEAPKKDKGETTPRKPPEREGERRRGAAERRTSGTAEEPREEIDPRETEGWTQPESSAQKGAPPDEG